MKTRAVYINACMMNGNKSMQGRGMLSWVDSIGSISVGDDIVMARLLVPFSSCGHKEVVSMELRRREQLRTRDQ